METTNLVSAWMSTLGKSVADQDWLDYEDSPIEEKRPQEEHWDEFFDNWS